MTSSGVTISGNNMNATTVSLRQKPHNQQQNPPKSNNPYFQQMIGNYVGRGTPIRDETDVHAQDNQRHNTSVSINQFDNGCVNETTIVPPPIPPPPIITPTNSTQGPSWC